MPRSRVRKKKPTVPPKREPPAERYAPAPIAGFADREPLDFRKGLAGALSGLQSHVIAPIPSAFEATEAWVEARAGWFAGLIVLLGLWLRFRLAGESYLNSDETQIMFPPLQHGLRTVYESALHMPYGPFNNFLLHFMTFFGNSEQYFRLVSAVPGALMAFVIYRWVAYLYGTASGLAAACIVSFSPAIVNLSAEVRHYMMHAFLLACSMYCLERAIGEQSRKWMRWFGATLLLALLTMYMSLWATVAIALYALLRILNRELPLRLIVEWALIQLAAAAISVIAFVTHLRFLRGSQGEVFARDGWLRGSYFHPGSDHLTAFLHTANNALFAYLFANNRLGPWMFYLFLAGIALIFWGKAGASLNRRLGAVSLLLPLIATLGVALLGTYPYGGSRHDAFLMVFVAPAVAVAISFLAFRKAAIVLLAALFLVPRWESVAQKNYLEVEPRLKMKQQMDDALTYLSQISPRPRVLVTDQNAATMIAHYVCHAKTEDDGNISASLSTFRCENYRILAVSDWSVKSRALQDALLHARMIDLEEFPDPAWIFSFSDEPPFTTSVTPNGAKFGRLYLNKISPPD